MNLVALFLTVLMSSTTPKSIGTPIAATDHLLVKTGLRDFAILTKEGFYTGNEQQLSTFIRYKDSAVLQSRTDIKEFKVCHIANTPYLLSPIEGYLYAFKDSLLQRVDEDLRQAYDYKPIYFTYNNELYTLGGKIIFNHKSSLKVFDGDTKQWKFMTTSGELPPGIKDGVYQLIGDELWVFHANEVEDNLDEKYIQNAYSINLKTLVWKKQGIINPDFIKNTEGQDIEVYKVAQGLMIFNKSNNDSYLTDIPSNKLRAGNLSNITTLSSNTVPIPNNKWVHTTLANGNKLQVVVAELELQNTADYFIRNQSIFFNMTMEFSAIGIMILLTFISFTLLSRRRFNLTPEGLSNGLKRIPLSEEEVQFLTILAEKKIVLNNEAMDIIHDANTTYDANIKRKNNLVSKIERKLKKTFSEVLFSRERYKDDMRHTAFYLKNGYSIKLLKETED